MKVLRCYTALHPQPHWNVWVLYPVLDFGRSDVGKYIGREPELEVSDAGPTLTLDPSLTLNAPIAWA